MPSNIIIGLAKKSGKSEAEVEKLWDKAKKLAKEEYPDVEVDSERYFKIVTGIVKKMLGIEEEEECGMKKLFNKILGEVSGGKKEYKAFIEKKLKKYGVKSPSELSKEDKKKFFDEVDKEWKAKKETD